MTDGKEKSNKTIIGKVKVKVFQIWSTEGKQITESPGSIPMHNWFTFGRFLYEKAFVKAKTWIDHFGGWLQIQVNA